jgi:trigger factor
VKEQELPDLDDDFAQMASEFDTLDELRADLRERAERRKRLTQAVTARDKTLDKLLEDAGEIPLPEGLIAAQVEEHFTDGHGDDDHRAEFESDLRRTLTSQFVLDELVKEEELQVSQEELTGYIIQRAAQSGIDPNQLAQQYVQSGNLPALMAEVARGKALALVVEKAEVVDTSGRPVDLDRLREEGTIAAPGTDEVLPSGIEFAELDESEEGLEDTEPAGDDGDEAART